MKKTVRVKVSAKPISSSRVRITSSVKYGGVTRTKTQTIRVK